MRRYIVFILCVLGVTHINAQVINDLKYYNTLIARLLDDCAAEKGRDFSKEHSIYIRDMELNDSDKLKFVKKIEELFQQKNCTELYRKGSGLLNVLFFYERDNISPIVRQKVIELYLKYYFYPYMDNGYIGYAQAGDFNEEAQKRLIEILEEKKTKEEYELYVRNARDILEPTERAWSEAARIMEKSGREGDDMLKQIRDSILEVRDIPSLAKRDFDYVRINEYLITRIGDLGLKNSIPTLQTALFACKGDNCQPNIENTYRITLARLGDKEQYDYMIDNMLEIDIFNAGYFSYFRDDALIWKYIEKNYTSKKGIWIHSDFAFPANFMTINNITPYVKNLPFELHYDNYGIRGAPNDDEWFKRQQLWCKDVYKWLMENKDTVKFDYDGEKKWII